MVNSKDIEKILYMVVGRSGLDNEARIIAKALNELMEYRAIGTIEEIQSMKDNGAFSGIELAQLAAIQTKLKDYQEIGTVKEFKTLKKKNVAKKAKWEFDDFTTQFGNPYRCSNCNEEFGDTHNYCPNCGCDMYAD